jgi:hypothetical protein
MKRMCLLLIKMSLHEIYSRVRFGRYLPDEFLIRNCLKQGDAVRSLLFNLALRYTIKEVQVNQDGLKLNGTYQLLVYADDINISGGRVHAIKKNTEALVVASKKTGLEIYADKTK